MGTCIRKTMRRAKMFVNISDETKNPSIRVNLLRGSSLCIGVSSFVNLNP